MDIRPTFEGWKANKRVTGEESKLNLPFQRLFFPSYLSGLLCECPNDSRLYTEVKTLWNDISSTRVETQHMQTIQPHRARQNKGGVNVEF